jgi:hypothetical protein
MQMMGIFDACAKWRPVSRRAPHARATRSKPPARLDAADEVRHASAVAAGHAVHLVHDERLLLHRAVEADGAVGDHLLHHVRALAVQARFDI